MIVSERQVVPRRIARAKGDLALRGQGDCADGVGQGVVEPPWRRWEEVVGSHVVEVETDGEDSREEAMNAIRQNVM